MDPTHAAFIQGLGDITPSQDHKPSLTCKVIVKTAGGLTEIAIRGKEPPKLSSHGVAKALMAARRDLVTESEAGSGIQRLWDGLDELLDSGEVFRVAIPQVLQIDTREGLRILFVTETLIIYMVMREDKSALWFH